MANEKQDFDRIRAALDAADDALARALDDRVKAILELRDLRANNPDAYFSLPRDNEVTARVLERVERFPRDAVRPVMTEILSACSELVAPLTVVYAGQEGGFGHLAARRQFGRSVQARGLEGASQVLAEVERGRADFGVLPFETSNDGAVTDTLSLLARGEVKLCAEIPVRRSFHLLSPSGDRSAVKKIYASASAIAACDDHLQRFSDAVVIERRSGMIAAQHAKDDPDAAALANDLVAELSGLTIVERALEDAPDLETRYVVVGNDYPPRTGRDRTAIALALHDAPGVLIDCMRPFADRGCNIYRLETRPARGWEFRYLILFEIDGHITDRPVLGAIEDLRAENRYVKVLGSYPRVGEE